MRSGCREIDVPPNSAHHPRHQHHLDGQEDVYVVLRRDGEIEIEGTPSPIDPDTVVRVGPALSRKVAWDNTGCGYSYSEASQARAYDPPDVTHLEAHQIPEWASRQRSPAAPSRPPRRRVAEKRPRTPPASPPPGSAIVAHVYRGAIETHAHAGAAVDRTSSFLQDDGDKEPPVSFLASTSGRHGDDLPAIICDWRATR
jgi:hypothetical protein